MTLKLTPGLLRAAYELLCEAPPFNKWNLPNSDDIAFRVSRDRTTQGWYSFDGTHYIYVSRNLVGYLSTLDSLMAHEMIHVHERHAGACKPGIEHSAAFKKWAAQVCAIHGWDPKYF